MIPSNPDIDLISLQQETKIGKVMRHISLAEDGKIPRDAEYNFRSRAQTVVEKWQRIAKEHEDAQANGVQTNGTAGGEQTAADQSAITADVTMASVEPNGTGAAVDSQSTDAPAAATNGTEPVTNGQASDAEMKVDGA